MVATVPTPVSNTSSERRSPRARPFVLLASRSPRRRALLAEHDIPHESVQPGFEDGVLVPGDVSPAQWVASLAYLKAWAGASQPEARAEGGRIVLGADTACLMNDRLIGTPQDAEEAERIIRAFVGTEHDVLTGVAMLDLRRHSGTVDDLPRSRQHIFTDRARVRFGEVSDQQISAYVASGQWLGKAGAYNLAERMDAGWPIHFEGDHTTIMGLPMTALVRRLERMD
jgi:septum formation protein